eukprot:g43390.t1
MFDMRSGPETYKVRVGVMVLNKHVGYMNATNSQTVRKQNMPCPLEQSERLLEPMDSLSPSSVGKSSESEMDMMDVAALTPLLLKEDSEILLRCSWNMRKFWLTDKKESVRDADTLIQDVTPGFYMGPVMTVSLWGMWNILYSSPIQVVHTTLSPAYGKMGLEADVTDAVRAGQVINE